MSFKQELDIGGGPEDFSIIFGHDGPDSQYLLSTIGSLSEFDLPLDSQGVDPLIAGHEDTMDADKYTKLVQAPVCTRGPPERDVFPGQFDFHVEVKSQDINKNKYLYSHKLNRIYVDMEKNFSVQFVWDYKQAAAVYSSVLVRATTVFSDISQAEKRVERCVQHTHDARNKDIDKHIVQNVLHSARELGALGVYYFGDPELTDSWYSVVVEFPPRGEEVCSHAFRFVCKNSCSSGINRRGIEVIFTLEDHSGLVLGRQRVGARVCSCPRRDMLRDESDASVRTKTSPGENGAPRAKKIKLDVGAEREDVVVLPPLKIIGTSAAVTGLKVMLSMMQQAVSLKKHDPQAVATYTTSIQALKAKIEEIKNGTKPPPNQ